MKKIIFAVFFALMAVGANAQVTFNVRVGAGLGTDHHGESGMQGVAQIQSNIPFSIASQFVFSPSVKFATEFDDALSLYAPITLGYKLPMGGRNIFIPRVGVAAGCELSEGDMIVGPTVGFDFEISHIVVGVNGYYSLVEAENENKYYDYFNHFNHCSINFTVGYKF